MTSIYEIATLTSVLTFSAWTLVVCAIAKFLFGSYPAAEILYRLAQRDKARQEHAANLSAATPVGEHAATVQGALLQPRIATAGQRLLSYFLTCSTSTRSRSFGRRAPTSRTRLAGTVSISALTTATVRPSA